MVVVVSLFTVFVDVSSESAIKGIETFSVLTPVSIGGYVTPNRKFVKRDESPQTEENRGPTAVGLTGLGRNQHLMAFIELIRCRIKTQRQNTNSGVGELKEAARRDGSFYMATGRAR